MILEMCLALALASALYVSYGTVGRQLAHHDLRMREKQALTALAAGVARLVVADPTLASAGAPALERAAQRLAGPGARGETVGVVITPRPDLAMQEVTVTVSRSHPVLGRCEGLAVVMLDAAGR